MRFNTKLAEAFNKSAPHPSQGPDADIKHATAICRAEFKGPDRDFKLTALQTSTIDAWVSERMKLRAWGVNPPRATATA